MTRHVKQSEAMRGAELDERSAGRVLEAHDAPTEARSPADEHESMIRRKGRSIGWLLGLAALIAALVFVYARPSGEKAAAPGQKQALAVPVTIAEVGVKDVPIYLEGLGTVQASNTVAIHSQVGGKLQSVNFTEGQMVKAGDVLAVVDPRPFRATLDQAKARRAQDEAQLVSDAKDLARFQDLMKRGAGTSQAVDQQQAKVDALKATIAADQAGIESAETQLSYSTIIAPIDGRVGFRQVDAGNIIRAGDETPITVLTAVTPINAVFTLPQRNLVAVQEAMKKGEVTVVAMDQDNVRALETGKLLLIDNQIDQTTSTIRMKAIFPNTDEQLWPGEFVRAQVLVETLKDAVTIPEAAVQRNSQGLFAWVIKADNTPENRPIQTGPTKNGMTVVRSGLQPGERVVVSGQYRLKPDTKVDIASPQTPAGPPAKP
jgi:multidrug efflux system membrane fusion protein